jgi:predicted TIM-barrel fold metal-dependent hydrolase
MKVIDFHIHIGNKDDWLPWVHEYQNKVFPELYERFEDIMNPEGLNNFLKSQGIYKAVILAENSPITTGVVSNEYVSDFCKGNDIFIPFASVNPRTDEQPAQKLGNLVLERNFKGLKLYPTYQHFYPNDNTLYPLYSKAVELNIPVMFHTGSSVFKGSRLKFGDPVHLDDVAVDFPDLKIIMAHSGRGYWYEAAFFLAELHKNIYMEVSGLPPKKLLNYFPNLEKNADKILFGSDWPGIRSIKENIDAIRSLPLKTSTIDKILGLNAQKLLGLNSD